MLFLLVIYTVSFSVHCHQSSCLPGQAHKLWIFSPMLWPTITMDIAHPMCVCVCVCALLSVSVCVCVCVCGESLCVHEYRCVWMYPIKGQLKIISCGHIWSAPLGYHNRRSWQGFLWYYSSSNYPLWPIAQTDTFVSGRSEACGAVGGWTLCIQQPFMANLEWLVCNWL